MLLDDLYQIKTWNAEEGSIEAELAINAEHSIFEGHFPENPVLPGACQVEMVGELLGKNYGQNFRLDKAQNIKFLSVVDPTKSKLLNFSLQVKEDGKNKVVKAIGKLESGEVCIKFSGIFSEAI
ncbi:hydroxymyristoyl-ACP dehydratase [Flammeovirgaceae bacterium SG7u.111]|nr:hydroxymyristoyl-ACP dehydratase [Flammeovirgaceae bacterium SG7u.132]WPO36154.1 hydroxymyristoyl-ACP dehydratase [Flammeovirgaceae bacterium SG7u.111]